MITSRIRDLEALALAAGAAMDRSHHAGNARVYSTAREAFYIAIVRLELARAYEYREQILTTISACT